MTFKTIFSVPFLRRCNCFVVLTFAVLILLGAFIRLQVSEKMFVQQLATLQVKLQYLDSLYKSEQDELLQLRQFVDEISISAPSSLDSASAIGSFTLPPPELKTEASKIDKSISGKHAQTGLNPPVMLHLSSSYYFLPHLLQNPSSLKLAYLMSKGRTGVSLVLGIPTVRRKSQSYLIQTLQNLVDGMSTEEADDTIMVIFIAETDIEYILQVAREIKLSFPDQVKSGLIEVVAPTASYYPNLDKLRITMGDSIEQVRWRSKQNLDFAFLMLYSHRKGTFYVQLEDDIIAKPHYVTEMKKFAMQKITKKKQWFVLDFCQLGFIGKMFKSAELPWLIQFFQMFYNDKPTDWLLYHFLGTKLCNLDKNDRECKKDTAKLWLHYKPSLFQHIGTQSSLNGKEQKLKDNQFGEVTLFFPHKNPDAEVVSGIKSYSHYTLQWAYLGKTFFWGLWPHPGDLLIFKFLAPIFVKRYFFRSGNMENPSDIFYNTTVEVLPLEAGGRYSSGLNVTSDGYIIVGKFDLMGIAEGSVSDGLGRIAALRLHVHSKSENWVILSEIDLQDGSEWR